MKHSDFVLRSAISMALAGAVAMPVWSQDKSNLVEEIVVTARKREESLQDVPFSVVAQTEEQLRNRGLTNIEDVATSVAGFTVQSLGPGQSQVAIRGVSAGQIVRDQPGVKEQVGVYLDESVISLSLFTPDIDLFDMNRVEVLRGPQGTLFGSGSLSGTVRYISNQPIIGEYQNALELQASSVEDGSAGGYGKAMVNLPIGDTAALRVAAWYRSDPGWIDAIQPDLSTQEDVNEAEVAGVRVSMLFEPNERLSITPRLFYQDVDADGFNRFDNFNILGNPFTTSRPAVTLNSREQFTQFEEEFTDEFTLFDLTVNYDLNDSMALTSITSWTERDILMVRDATQLTASITGGSIGLGPDVYNLDAPLDDATDLETFTQELRLSGGDEDFDWLVGFFYSDIDKRYGQSLDVSGFEALTGIPTAGVVSGTDILFYSDIPYSFEQLALFGEATWSVNDRLDLTAGLRYYDFEESRVLNFDGIFADQTIGQAGKTSSDGVNGRIMASYAWSEDTQINGQISQGFRLGGINDPLNVPLCTPEDLATFGGRDSFDDEELVNYEVGIKSSIMDGRGTFNISAFYMDIENLQATLTAGSCSSRVIFNVPEAESTGLEIEWAAQLTDNFDFAISASFIDSELKSTVTTTDASGVTTPIGGVVSGNPLPTVPETQIAAAGNYEWTISDTGWDGFVTGIWSYVDERYTQFGDLAPGFGSINLEAYGEVGIGGPFTQSTFTFDPKLPSYNILNTRIGARNDRWEVSFFINNLTDEEAYLAIDQERGTQARQGYLVNKPRTYGVTARFGF